MRYLAFLIALLTVGSLTLIQRKAAAYQVNEEPSRCQDNWLASVSIYIITGPDSLEEADGSGIVVQDGFILTNAHVIGRGVEGALILVRYNTPEKIVRIARARLERIDYELDLALLSTSEKFSVAVELGDDRMLHRGSFVYAHLNWLGVKHQIYTEGYFSGYEREGELRLSIKAAPSSSGSGIFDAEGKLVGLTVSINFPPFIWAFVYAIPVSTIRLFLANEVCGVRLHCSY